MDRILFQRAPNGFRTVRGEIIRKLQQLLHDKGVYRETPDGVYGDKTEHALLLFQQQNNLPVTSKVDNETWTALTATAMPDLKQRCLEVTADFEGTGFSKIVGNFDGAGLTWGIIGFTLFNGQLQKVLNEIKAAHPDVFAAAFGSLAAQMATVLKSPLQKQMAFADAISLGSSKVKVEEEWAQAFDALGNHPAVQGLQLQHTEKFFDVAQRDVNRFELKNELGFALCFDIAVQNGGIDGTEADRIRRKAEQNRPATQQDLRIIVANVVAENSRPQFVDDVRKRKMTFATGTGTVHGAQYAVKTWGLDELPA